MAKPKNIGAQDGAMRAYIYGRYSSHSQKDTSIEQQFEEIYKYCEQNNIRIIGEYADRGISGKTDKISNLIFILLPPHHTFRQ